MRETEEDKARVKRISQDLEWVPPIGIHLMKRNTVYEPVGSANFRFEDLMLDKILANLSSYVKRMPTYIRVRVTESWLKLNN